MIRALRRALPFLVLAGPAVACPEASDRVLFMSCWGEATAEIRLLPEDGVDLPAEASRALVVTGAYTGVEPRREGHPKPVGLFLRRGEVVSREFARMDGLLIIGEDGVPRLHHAARMPAGNKILDLGNMAEREAFLSLAGTASLSILQSHLLVVDGEIDVREREDAPSFRRRLLFTLPDGDWGVYDTGLRRTTLYEAAVEVAETLRPAMALNLDMGSYDFCLDRLKGGEVNCGVLAPGDTGKLSNILIFRLAGPN